MSKHQATARQAEGVDEEFECIEKDDIDEADDRSFIIVDGNSEDEASDQVNVKLSSRPQSSSSRLSNQSSKRDPSLYSPDYGAVSPQITVLYERISQTIKLISRCQQKEPNLELDALRDTCYSLFASIRSLWLNLERPSYKYAQSAFETDVVLPNLSSLVDDSEQWIAKLSQELVEVISDENHPAGKSPLDSEISMKTTADVSLTEAFTSISVHDERDWKVYDQQFTRLYNEFKQYLVSLEVVTRKVWEKENAKWPKNRGRPSALNQSGTAKLRSELYRLRDTLSSLEITISELSHSSSVATSDIIISLAPDIKKIVTALTRCLTNTNREWSENESRNGLSFEDFRDIDPDIIKNIQKVMHDWNDGIKKFTTSEELLRELVPPKITTVEEIMSSHMQELLEDIDYKMDIISELKEVLKA